MRISWAALPGVAAILLLCAPLPALAQHAKNATLDIQAQSTFASGSDEQAAPGGLPLTDGKLRVPFKFTLPYKSKFQFVLKRRYIDETLGRVTQADGAYKYPGGYHDIATDGSVGYTTGTATWSVGYYQRHRECCPYDKVEEHLPYLGVEDDFGPKVGTKTMFEFTLQGLRSANHKQSASFLAANAPGYTYADYKGNLFIYRVSLLGRFPLAKTVTFLAKAGIDSDYFDYDPIPLYYNYLNLGAAFALSPNVTYTLQVDNLTQRDQGYPFVAPNAIHRAKIVLTADFKAPL